VLSLVGKNLFKWATLVSRLRFASLFRNLKEVHIQPHVVSFTIKSCLVFLIFSLQLIQELFTSSEAFLYLPSTQWMHRQHTNLISKRRRQKQMQRQPFLSRVACEGREGRHNRRTPGFTEREREREGCEEVEAEGREGGAYVPRAWLVLHSPLAPCHRLWMSQREQGSRPPLDSLLPRCRDPRRGCRGGRGAPCCSMGGLEDLRCEEIEDEGAARDVIKPELRPPSLARGRPAPLPPTTEGRSPREEGVAWISARDPP
jgi:hypothetical protein